MEHIKHGTSYHTRTQYFTRGFFSIDLCNTLQGIALISEKLNKTTKNPCHIVHAVTVAKKLNYRFGK